MGRTPASLKGPTGAALAAFPWLNPFTFGPSPGVAPWLAGMACGLALWLLALGGTRTRHLPHKLAWSCAALVAWAALSQMALRPEMVMLAGGLTLAVLGASLSTDEELGGPLQAGVLAAAAVSAVIGFCQYFGLASWFSPWVNAAEAGEAYANLRQPNQYASLCWIGGAILLFGTLRLPRWARFALVMLLAGGSAASVSRTGMLQGLVLTLLSAWWAGPQRQQRLVLCAVAALAYFAATVLLPVVLEAVNGAMPARTLWGRLGGGQPCSSRRVLWSNVLQLVALHPLTGWGWGELDYAHFDTLYAGGTGARFCDILDNAHSLPLHLAVELGVPAALLVCGAAAWWAWRQQPWGEDNALRQLAWAVLALVLLHSLLEYPLWYAPFQIVSGAALGWLLRPPAARHAAPAARAPGAIAAVLLLAATGYAAWDYTRVSQIYLPPEQRSARWSENTLDHVRRSWLFAGQARFAELTLVTPQRENALWMHDLSRQVLHYSPEPRVIERAIESATYLGRIDEAVLMLARYRAAFPRDYEAWRQAQRMPPQSGR